jgi:hypothetical protein
MAKLFITSDDISTFIDDIGECVEYDGEILRVMSADNIAPGAGEVLLQTVRDPDLVEMPEPFEHFMARHKARITAVQPDRRQ